MSCAASDTFRLDPTGTLINVGNTYEDVCKATKILDRLHQDFTETYANGAAVDTIKHKPSFHLRNQLTSLTMSGETTAPTNRFYNVFTTKSEGDPSYNGVVSAILKGQYDTDNTSYKNYPTSISSQTNFDNTSNFKGIYGLHKVNELLEGKIREKIDSMTPKNSDGNVNISDFNKYEKRQGIKATMEEIANREIGRAHV